MNRITINSLIAAFLTFAFLNLPGQAKAIHVSPEHVDISAMYNGSEVFVTGEIQNDEEAVVQVIGPSSEVDLQQRGKVGGFLWMTIGHLTIANAPNAYLVYLPDTINTWRLENEPRWKKLGIDFPALQAEIEIEPAEENSQSVFNDFVKLKTSDALYQIVGDAIQYEKTPEGDKEFKATIHIPAKIPLETYQVRVLRVRKDGEIAGVEEAQLQFAETGFPEFISKMAFKNSLLYGILSVGIALFAGLFMGILFKDRGGAH